MSNHNYKQYYNNKPKEQKQAAAEKPVPEKPVKPAVVEPELEEQKPVVAETPVIEEPVIESTKPAEHVIGKVANCKLLNIRIAPRKFADVIAVVNADSELVVSLDQSEGDWYSVCTAAGVEGYCMKEFVKI